MQIWEAVNECFDVMPIAATVDEKVRLLFFTRKALNIFRSTLGSSHIIEMRGLILNLEPVSFSAQNKYTVSF